MGERMRRGRREDKTGTPMTPTEAEARRRAPSEREGEKRHPALRDRRPAGREAPGPVRADEQAETGRAKS